MNRKNKNKNKRGRRLNYGQPRNAQMSIPSRFPRPGGDLVTLHCKGLVAITASASGFSKGCLWMLPYSATVATLATLVPNLDAMSQLYSRFIVNNMTVRIIPTISVLQGATFAVNYEPALTTIPATAGNPQSLNDVVISVHHCVTTQSQAKSYSCRPIDYYGDWRSCESDQPASTENNQGLIQWYSSYTAEGSPTIGQIEVNFVISFCGLRQFTAA